MELINLIVLLVGLVVAEQISPGYADSPCAATFYNQSSVCVCNSTYCDTITRSSLWIPGTFMTYTSSKEGKRFSKERQFIKKRSTSYDDDGKIFDLDPSVTYQKIEGFGGGATDSAGINLKSLPEAAQQKLIDSYFSKNGIEYNMLRLPIGSTDFSLGIYTYDDTVNDTLLTNFSLASADYDYKIPLIKNAQAAATDFIKIVSASWSPPGWMKDNNMEAAGGSVKPEFFQAFADYHCRFAEEYKKHGIDIWATSTSNEPSSPLLGVKFQSTLWYLEGMADFITNHLGPTLEKCSAQGIKILAVDDQRPFIALYFLALSYLAPATLQYVDGFAVHSYLNTITPASIATSALAQFPDKFAISTEYCAGSTPYDIPKVDLGSWTRAEDYVKDILENLNSNFVGWIDWNLCLNRQGGPTWIGNYVDSPVIVDAKRKEFYKQPMFYAMGHFSKFVPRGSQRIKMSAVSDQLGTCNTEPSKEYAAFITPRDTLVVILYNDGPAREAVVRVGTCDVITQLDADSFTTIEMPTKHNNPLIRCRMIKKCGDKTNSQKSKSLV